MKQFKKISVRGGLLVLLGIAVLTLAVGTSVAIYTNQGYQKGVAVTTENIAMFSSDLLEQITKADLKDETNIQKKNASILFAQQQATGSFEFNVYNYAPNMPTRVNPSDIGYTITIKIKNYDASPIDASLFLVKSGETTATFTDGVCTLAGQMLNHGQSRTNTYEVILTRTAVEKGVRLIITAVPESTSVNAVNDIRLAAEVIPIISGGGGQITASWTGHWVEASVAELLPSGCTAFNYEISGTGEGTVTVTLPKGLKFDPYFKEGTIANGTLTLTVNSDIQSVYNIRFYRAGSLDYNEEDFTGWPSISKFTEKAE